MGLDMYLTRVKYVRNWNHTKPEKRFQGVAFQGNTAIDLSKLTHLEFNVKYWRKHNAIHNWFVENVQEGVDDCKRYYVDREKLEMFLITLEMLVRNRDIEEAKKILPPTDGFFFGSTEIDDWYWDELYETLHELQDDMELNKKDEYYYQSSW